MCHQREVCHFDQKAQLRHFDYTLQSKLKKLNMHRRTVHNKIYCIHLENT